MIATLVFWDEYEKRYSERFKSSLGNVAKPCRMALWALIIQKRQGFSDRELVEEITENPYLQYFIGLPGYQETSSFDASTLVYFRKRLNIDMKKFMNDKLLELQKAKRDGARKKKAQQTKTMITMITLMVIPELTRANVEDESEWAHSLSPWVGWYIFSKWRVWVWKCQRQDVDHWCYMCFVKHPGSSGFPPPEWSAEKLPCTCQMQETHGQ